MSSNMTDPERVSESLAWRAWQAKGEAAGSAHAHGWIAGRDYQRTQAATGAEGEVARLREELADTMAHEHVLVIVGDMLARQLEWMVEEPTSGLLDAELLDAIKARAKPGTEQWLQAITNAGFKRPAALTPARPAGSEEHQS